METKAEGWMEAVKSNESMELGTIFLHYGQIINISVNIKLYNERLI